MDRSAHQSMAAAQDVHWWFKGRRVLLDDILNRVAADNSWDRPLQILEIGSGTGGNLDVLSAHGEVTALEPSAFAAAIARGRHPQITIVEDFWPQAAARMAEFDIIVMMDVLEHLQDDRLALAEARNHLAPYGALIVTVPAYPGLWSEHDVSLSHFRRYGRRAFIQLAQGAGMRIELLTNFNSLLVGAAWLGRKLGLRAATGDNVPPSSINALLALILRFEVELIRLGVRWPFGLSIAAILREA